MPLLLHWRSMRRRGEIPWGATSLLASVGPIAMRRHLWRRRILLAVRMLACIFVGLALAEPRLSTALSLAYPAGRAPVHTIVVWDGSFSMTSTVDGKSRWQRGCTALEQLAAAAHVGDTFSFLSAANTTTTLLVDGTASELQERCARGSSDRRIVTEQPANLHHAMEAALRTVVLRDQGPAPAHRLVIVSDLCQNSWEFLEHKDTRPLVHHFPAGIDVFDVGGEPSENLAAVSLEMVELAAITGQSITLLVQITNWGTQACSECPVELSIDGQSRDRSVLTNIPPRTTATLRFSTQFDQAGEHICEIGIGPDAIPLDNHRYLTVPVHEPRRVLCISGDPQSAELLRLALSPPDTRLMFRAETEVPTATWEERLEEYDCLVLCDVPRLTSSQGASVGRFVTQGGGALIIAGPQINTVHYNADLPTHGLRLPSTLGDPLTAQPAFFDPRGYEHPIVRPFRGHDSAGLLNVPVWTHRPLEPRTDADVRVALWLTSGQPVLLEGSHGRGRIAVLGTSFFLNNVHTNSNTGSLSAERHVALVPWSMLAAWPSFPPLVHQLVLYTAGGADKGRAAIVGDRLTGYAPSATRRVSIYHGPREEEVRVVDEPAQGPIEQGWSEVGRWSYPATQQAGFYRVVAGNDLPLWYAVNVDARESDPARISSAALPDGWNLSTITGDAPPEPRPPQLPRVVTATRPLLWLVLTLLVAESLLVGRYSWRPKKEKRS